MNKRNFFTDQFYLEGQGRAGIVEGRTGIVAWYDSAGNSRPAIIASLMSAYLHPRWLSQIALSSRVNYYFIILGLSSHRYLVIFTAISEFLLSFQCLLLTLLVVENSLMGFFEHLWVAPEHYWQPKNIKCSFRKSEKCFLLIIQVEKTKMATFAITFDDLFEKF